ncbi:Gfo/Idh/MocA family oxidoreductase [Micromonospora rifamycinica]|uniref:Gfo/Idh/MocA family protein n=1 Tax=Micromonospora rifamycinica TaxID=291594 RepID=UPI002E2B85C0|nr:Gfo/Idh/MocA family oxidoreductase [Micromonospora rifamycinica]
MTTRVRLGLVGCGSHAWMAILPALRFAPIDLVAVCDTDPARAERVAEAYGASARYARHQDLLATEEVDVVAVVGPPGLHHSVGLDVLAAGRHLFVEKPPAMSYRAACELAAAAGDRQVMVGFQKRYARAYQLARQAALGADFGRPSMLRLNYSHVRTAPLLDHLAFMSIHALDLARFFMGDVVAGTVHLSVRDGQHVIALTLEHSSGAASMLALSALEPRLQETLELAGDSTLLRVRDLTELTVERAAPLWADADGTTPAMMQSWRPDFTIPTDHNNSLVLQGYAGEMIELADAVLTGRPVGGNIDDAVQAMRLVEALRHAPPGFSRLDLD